jgi:hypothetical protein
MLRYSPKIILKLIVDVVPSGEGAESAVRLVRTFLQTDKCLNLVTAGLLSSV